MNPTTDHGNASSISISRNPLATDIATLPQNNQAARALGFALGSVLTPIALGVGLGALLRSRRLGLVAGGASALACGLVRWQLQRWFTDEPRYEVERVDDDIEIRRYLPRVEAHTRLATHDFDEARERGFRRLAGYIFGANAREETLEMTCPVTIAPRPSSHTVAFVMPPHQRHSELPHPDDARVELVDVPARRVAVLRYRGGYRAATVARHAEHLRERCAALGLTALGEPIFAGFDPPTTLPLLRRSEIWLELV